MAGSRLPDSSGLSGSVVVRISERGARMARRDNREYREYFSRSNDANRDAPPESRATNDADRPLGPGLLSRAFPMRFRSGHACGAAAVGALATRMRPARQSGPRFPAGHIA